MTDMIKDRPLPYQLTTMTPDRPSSINQSPATKVYDNSTLGLLTEPFVIPLHGHMSWFKLFGFSNELTQDRPPSIDQLFTRGTKTLHPPSAQVLRV